MLALAKHVPCDDSYLFFKFEQLQEAAKRAGTRLKAISRNATVEDKGVEVMSTLDRVDRFAMSISTIQPVTNAGATMKARAMAWLARGNLDSLSALAAGAA